MTAGGESRTFDVPPVFYERLAEAVRRDGFADSAKFARASGLARLTAWRLLTPTGRTSYQATRGRPWAPRFETVVRVADFLHVSLDWLLGRSEYPTIPYREQVALAILAERAAVGYRHEWWIDASQSALTALGIELRESAICAETDSTDKPPVGSVAPSPYPVEEFRHRLVPRRGHTGETGILISRSSHRPIQRDRVSRDEP